MNDYGPLECFTGPRDGETHEHPYPEGYRPTPFVGLSFPMTADRHVLHYIRGRCRFLVPDNYDFECGDTKMAAFDRFRFRMDCERVRHVFTTA